MTSSEENSNIDFEKCQNCTIPISYCDGMTRFKCGHERKNVRRYCIYDRISNRDESV